MIQERSLLPALLPSERLYVLDHGNFFDFIYFRIRENHSMKMHLPPQHTQSQTAQQQCAAAY